MGSQITCPLCLGTKVVQSGNFYNCKTCDNDGNAISEGFLVPLMRRYRLCADYYAVTNDIPTDLTKGTKVSFVVGRGKKIHQATVVFCHTDDAPIFPSTTLLLEVEDKKLSLHEDANENPTPYIICTDKYEIEEAYSHISHEGDVSWRSRKVALTIEG